MTHVFTWLVVIGLVCVPRHAAAQDAVVIAVIVNAHNHDSISGTDLEDIFLRKQAHWASGDRIIPINLAPDTKLRRVFDRVVLGMAPDEIAKYWLDQRIRNGSSAPRELDDPAVALRIVTRFDGAIAYVPATTDLRDVRVIARIRDGKLLVP